MVYLNCKLTQFVFHLFLKVEKEGEVVCEEVILETDPDEVAFEYRFKDIIIQEDKLIITSKTSENLFTKKLGDF